jgi:VIT1/CCC1 family predicted Fe2+/Mn2+ transporter
MDNNIVLVQLPLETLYQEISEIIKRELQAQSKVELKEKLLSGAEACKLFCPAISKVTLSSWAAQG